MSRTEDIARAIAAKLVSEGELLDGLTDRLGGAALKSLLMHVLRERSRRRTAPELLHQLRRDRALAPSAVDRRRLLEVEALALKAAERFEALDLAPTQPLGTSSALGDIDQNKVLATIATSEVASDPTNTLAAGPQLACPDRFCHDDCSERGCVGYRNQTGACRCILCD